MYTTVDEMIYDMKKWGVYFQVIDGNKETYYGYDEGVFYRDMEDWSLDDYDLGRDTPLTEKEVRDQLDNVLRNAKRVYAKTVFIINERA